MGDTDADGGAFDRADAERRDRADPLAGFRDRFAVPAGERYMDGNSLGLASADAEAALDRVVGEALRDRGVVVDFRPPNVVRVCPAPLYTRFVDVWAVVETVREVAEAGAHLAYDERAGGVT